MKARPAFWNAESKPLAPTMTSLKPSPFTSPAEATSTPKAACTWSGSALQSAVLEGPSLAPRNTKAAPSAV